MATSTASGYGTYAPAAIDPFPIESVLAKIVGENNPAEAANMLDTYQIQNQTSQGNYNYAMGQQHDFAKQALQQQLYEANLKGLAEAKDPTVLGIMANAPGYQQVFGGAGQNAISGALQRAQAEQGAKTFQAGMTGLNQGAQGGYQVSDTSTVPGLPANLQLSNRGPALVQAAEIRAGATDRATAARGTQEGKTSVNTTLPAEADGTTHTVSSRVPSSQVGTTIDTHNRIAQGIQTQRAGGGSGVGPGVGGGSGSTLPPAKTDTPANRPGGNTQLDTNSPNGKMAQGGATIAVDRASRSGDPRGTAMAADVKAGMRSATVYDTHMGPDGKPYVRGKSGSFYPIQN